jgi:ribokinase
MQSYDVITVGNALIDAFLHVTNKNMNASLDVVHKTIAFTFGEKIHVDECQFLVGGNAANVAVGMGRLGAKSALFAEIGDDAFSKNIMQLLTKEPIDTTHIIQDANSPASFAVGINYMGERTLFVDHVRRKHEFSFEGLGAQWMYLTSLGDEWKATYGAAVEFAKTSGSKIAFSPGTHQIEAGYEFIKEVLLATTLLCVNKEEGMNITNFQFSRDEGDENMQGIKELLRKLKEMGPRIVSITDGTNGSYALDEQGAVWHIGMFPNAAVERTGAGDAYATGFLAALLHTQSVPEAMRWGAFNAAGVVEKVGAQAGLLTQEHMQQQLAAHPDFKAKQA